MIRSPVRPPVSPLRKVVAAAALACLLAGSADADDLRLANRNYLNITVLDLRDGSLRFQTAQGVEALAPLPQVQRFTSAATPALSEAFDALDNGDDAGALARFITVQRSSGPDHVRAIATARLIQLHDKAGRADEAVRLYIELARLTSGPALEPLTPRNLPADRDERLRLAQTVAEAIAKSESAAVRVALRKFEDTLRADPAAATPAAASATPAAPGTTSNSPPAVPADQATDPIQRLLDSGDTGGALREIDAAIEKGGLSLSRLLYQRGLAHTARGDHSEAAIAFMRVVIHFKPSTSRYYLPSLIEAGRSFQKLNQPRHARTLWTEARALTANDAEQAGEIDRLLASLPTADQP